MVAEIKSQTDLLVSNMNKVAKRKSLESELAKLTALVSAKKVEMKMTKDRYRDELLTKMDEFHQQNIRWR